MSSTPTATAVAEKFQNKDGSDLVQYLNSQGQIVLLVDADGVLRISTTAAQGAVLQWDCQVPRKVSLSSRTASSQFDSLGI